MIEEFQKSGARVVLAGMTLPPNYGAGYIAKFEAVYRDLAAKYKVTLIPFLLEGVGGDRGTCSATASIPTPKEHAKSQRW